jgi:hypothetical protein
MNSSILGPSSFPVKYIFLEKIFNKELGFIKITYFSMDLLEVAKLKWA